MSEKHPLALTFSRLSSHMDAVQTMNEMSPYTGAPSTGNPILSGDSGHAPQVALLTCSGLSALLGTDGIRYQTCWLCTNTTKFPGACQGRGGETVETGVGHSPHGTSIPDTAGSLPLR